MADTKHPFRMSETRKRLLLDISTSPGKSGNFWRNLGHATQTIRALEEEGLIEGRQSDYSATVTYGSQQWTLTDKGREMLDAPVRGWRTTEKAKEARRRYDQAKKLAGNK